MVAGKSGWGRAGPSSGLLAQVHETDHRQGHSTAECSTNLADPGCLLESLGNLV